MATSIRAAMAAVVAVAAVVVTVAATTKVAMKAAMTVATTSATVAEMPAWRSLPKALSSASQHLRASKVHRLRAHFLRVAGLANVQRSRMRRIQFPRKNSIKPRLVLFSFCVHERVDIIENLGLYV